MVVGKFSNVLAPCLAFVLGALWVDWLHDTPMRSYFSSGYNPPSANTVKDEHWKHAFAYYKQGWEDNVDYPSNKLVWQVMNVVIALALLSSILELRHAFKSGKPGKILVDTTVLVCFLVSLVVFLMYVVNANKVFTISNPSTQDIVNAMYSKAYGHLYPTLLLSVALFARAFGYLFISVAREGDSKKRQ